MGFFLLNDKATAYDNQELVLMNSALQEMASTVTHLQITPYGWSTRELDEDVVANAVYQSSQRLFFLTFGSSVSRNQKDEESFDRLFVIRLVDHLRRRYAMLCALNFTDRFFLASGAYQTCCALLKSHKTPNLVCIDLSTTKSSLCSLDLIRAIHTNRSTRIVKIVFKLGESDVFLRDLISVRSSPQAAPVICQIHLQESGGWRNNGLPFLWPPALNDTLLSLPHGGIADANPIEPVRERAKLEVGPPLNQTKSIILDHSFVCLKDVSAVIGRYHGHLHLDVCMNVVHFEMTHCWLKDYRVLYSLLSAVRLMRCLKHCVFRAEGTMGSIGYIVHFDPEEQPVTLQPFLASKELRHLDVKILVMTVTVQQLSKFLSHKPPTLEYLSLEFGTFKYGKYVRKDWKRIHSSLLRFRGLRRLSFQREERTLRLNRHLTNEWMMLLFLIRMCLTQNRIGGHYLKDVWDSSNKVFKKIWDDQLEWRKPIPKEMKVFVKSVATIDWDGKVSDNLCDASVLYLFLRENFVTVADLLNSMNNISA